MNDFCLLDAFLGTLTHDLMRYVIGAGGVWLVINIALAARLARRKIQPGRPGWPQFRREILASLRTVLVFAVTGTGIVAGAVAGVFRIYPDVGTHGWAWLVLSTVAVIVAHDAWFYWVHRLLHHRRLWRWMHRLHHRSRTPTPFTSYAFDIGEAVANAAFLPVVLLVLPMHPAALLVFTGHMMLRNALGHCGYEIFPAGRDGRPLIGWMTTVTHHDLHHAGGPFNFGFYFTWWDRWMGTEHPRYLQEFARVARPVRWRLPGAAAAMLIAALAIPDPAGARDLDGVYATPGLGFLVRFGPCPEVPAETCGTIVWAWDPARARHVAVGGQMIRGLRWTGRSWTEGTLRDPETGDTYGGEVEPANGGAITLSGCKALFLCESQTWPLWERLWERLPRPAGVR